MFVVVSNTNTLVDELTVVFTKKSEPDISTKSDDSLPNVVFPVVVRFVKVGESSVPSPLMFTFTSFNLS